MTDGLRERAFSALADIGLRRPAVLLGIVVVLMAVSAVFIPRLGVSTSRTGLVADDDPQQAALLDFYDRFGRPDSAVFLVSGGEPEQRREVVDRLQAELSRDEAFAGRVLGRVDAQAIAPLLLVQQPEALIELRRGLPADADPTTIIEGGLPAWLGAIEAQIYAQLDGVETAGADAATGPGAAEAADEGLRRLAMLAGVLDAVIVGDDPMTRLSADARFGAQPGLDSRGYLVTSDGDAHLVTVFAELPSDEGVEVAPIVERLRAVRDAVMADAPAAITADLTGMPALITDELAILQLGLRDSTIATTLGIAVLCLLLFRSLWQMFVALVPLAPGVLATLAVVQVLYDDLNLITASFVAVLLGLGIDFSVHAISRFNEEVRAGTDPDEAVRSAMAYAGPGVLTGAVVTAAAFLTSATTDFTAFGELGIVTAVGLIIVVACTFMLLPALLRRRAGPVRVAPEPPGLAKLPGLVRTMAYPLTVLGLVAAAAGGFALPSIDFNARYFDFLPEQTEASRALNRLEYDPLASPVFANLRADSIEEARAMTTALRDLDSVAGVQTPSDLLPPLTPDGLASLRAGLEGLRAPDFDVLAAKSTDASQLGVAAGKVVDALDESRLAMSQAGLSTDAMDETIVAFKGLRDRAKNLDEESQARLASIEAGAAAVLGPAWATASAVATRGGYAPADVPSLFAHRYVSNNAEQVALYVVPSGQFWDQQVAERFRHDMVAIDPMVSGLATVHVRHGEIVVDGFRRAALMAAVLVLLILALDFRSITDAILAMVPTVVGWMWMIGLMVLTGLRFDVANVVSMPLVLGIGIAFGVHMMHRCREVEQRDDPADGRLSTVVRGTGGAIAVAALTTMVGFGGLTISDYGAMKSFGGLMMLGIGTCLLATVLVLPALLVVLRRVR
ncbi:MAG: MMPL family transporter [Deltaproteobacteria bacterium]|nr:MMPL family transporter [Deltaproteobacteria bacterium]